MLVPHPAAGPVVTSSTAAILHFPIFFYHHELQELTFWIYFGEITHLIVVSTAQLKRISREKLHFLPKYQAEWHEKKVPEI